MNMRIESQINHFFEDGVHDENSFYYIYRMIYSFNEFIGLFSENENSIDLSVELTDQLKAIVEKANIYSLYAIKPVEPKLNDTTFFTDSDIPAIGDTWPTINGKFGKNSADSSYFSFMDEQIKLGYDTYFTYPNLKDYIEFVVKPYDNTSFKFDFVSSKYFEDSGVFISRSNWTDENSKYDFNSRYCYFKGGELVSTPGPYFGFKTSSKHTHADLLSVELSAHNNNLITELGGVINPGDEDLIKNFDHKKFLDLYGYQSEMSDFLRVRHYFKGTAAHNTLYVNESDQIEFLDHYKWQGLDKVINIEPHHYISDEVDFYSAGYIKEHGETYSAKRDFYYLKPHNASDQIENDYWFFRDLVLIDNQNREDKIEQIWHLALSQNVLEFNTAGGYFEEKQYVHSITR